jgi:hypothetical protein
MHPSRVCKLHNIIPKMTDSLRVLLLELLPACQAESQLYQLLLSMSHQRALNDARAVCRQPKAHAHDGLQTALSAHNCNITVFVRIVRRHQQTGLQCQISAKEVQETCKSSAKECAGSLLRTGVCWVVPGQFVDSPKLLCSNLARNKSYSVSTQPCHDGVQTMGGAACRCVVHQLDRRNRTSNDTACQPGATEQTRTILLQPAAATACCCLAHLCRKKVISRPAHDLAVA